MELCYLSWDPETNHIFLVSWNNYTCKIIYFEMGYIVQDEIESERKQ